MSQPVIFATLDGQPPIFANTLMLKSEFCLLDLSKPYLFRTASTASVVTYHRYSNTISNLKVHNIPQIKSAIDVISTIG